MCPSILSNFPSSHRAQEAADALRWRGFHHVQVDRVTRYPCSDPADPHYNNPIAGQAGSLTGLTVFSSNRQMDPDARPMVAADPSVSGMSSPGGQVRGAGILLTVVCPHERLHEAVEIIKEYGGEV